ncbi:MAG TPA: hypothetical protein DD791_10805 [Syntrophomonas sp.]|jgi:hypothetical protein|nr:hypothetical protein [Syntrophomonas sp.]
MDDLNIATQGNELQYRLDKAKKRKRIWEISHDLSCSVCGTCLDLDEQRMILKKLHIDHKTFTDHDIHACMVQSLCSENKLSRRLESHLNDKYRYVISQFGELDEDQFMAVWQDHMKSGDICGLYWIAVTHKGLSEKSMHNIFCEVHMLSHLNGGKVRKEKSEYDRLFHVNSDLQAKLQQEKEKRKELAKELASLEKIRRNLETKIRSLEKTRTHPPDKPYQMLPSSSLSSISCALTAAGKVDPS